MSQKRIQDYGSPVLANSLKKLAHSFSNASVLRGMEFLVDSADRVRINPGSAITHEGVIITEDEFKTITIPNTSNPVDYTIYYSHEDADISGGVSANLISETGLLTPDVINGVILGYVRYPGGGVPLALSHFIQPQPLQIGIIAPTINSANWTIPIRNYGYMVTNTSGGAITITDTYDDSGPVPLMYVKFRNNSLATGSITVTFPFLVGDNPYAIFQAVIGTDINTLVTPIFIDSNGSSTVLASPYSGQPSLLLKTASLPRASLQNSNSMVYLQFQMELLNNREIKVQAVGLNTYNLPV